MSGPSKDHLSIGRSQDQVRKGKVILLNNEGLHSHHVIRVLGIGLGVKFDGDIHFIIRVHLGQTV